MVSINNNIITMNRGDTFTMPVVINYGTKFAPQYYSIGENDTVYFAIEECNQKFEDAVVKKVFDAKSSTENGFVVTLLPTDTEYLLAGEYNYEIKLKHIYKDDFGRDREFIDTIVPRKKFIILE